MSLRLKLKNKLIENRTSPFLLQPFTAVVIAAVYGFVILLFTCFFEDLTYQVEETLLLLFSFTLLFYIVFFIMLWHQCRLFRKEKKDRRRNDFKEETVFLKFSEPLRKKWYLFFPNIFLGFYFYGEHISYQKCTFCTVEGKTDYFYYILSSDKLDALKKFYKTDVSYWNLGLRPDSVVFDEGVPFQIKYGSLSHVLFDVDLSEGYEYSLEQEKAIQRLWVRVSCKKTISYLLKPRKSGENEYVKKLNTESRNACWVSPLFFLFFAIVCAVLLSCFVSLFFDYLHSARLIYPYEMDPLYYLRVFLFYGGFAYLVLMIFFVGLFGERGDRKHSRYKTENVMFSVSMTRALGLIYCEHLKMIYKEEHASIQKLFFVPLGKFQKDTTVFNRDRVYYIMTEEFLEAMSKLYRCVPASYGVGLRFDFVNGVPLKIVYGRDGRVLKAVLPVENYSYTEEQLAAMEELSNIFPSSMEPKVFQSEMEKYTSTMSRNDNLGKQSQSPQKQRTFRYL